MESNRINILIIFILSLFLNACNTGGIQGNDTNADSYPSQFLTGEVYILKTDETINGNISGFDTTLILEEGSIVTGDISLFGSELEISGQVNGDVNIFAGTAHILESAVINGDVNQIANQINVENGARIGGEINSFTFPDQKPSKPVDISDDWDVWLQPKGWVIYQIIRGILLTLSTLLVIFLFKAPTLRVADQIKEKPAVTWGVGLLLMIAIPIVSLIFLITICLSPIALVLIIVYLIANLWGWTAISLIVGDQLTSWLKIDWREEASVSIGAILLGIVFTILALIPFAGFLTSILISAFGTGGVLLSKFDTQAKK